MQPSEYSRRVLLAVSGMSPAIITETLYSIACVGEPSFIPTEIHIISTTIGADFAQQTLLDKTRGEFHALCKAYGLPAIKFDRDTFHVLTDAKGREMGDVLTPGDNERCADFIMDVVRELTADADSALHVSIAGGRKSMGYYVGYMMSLFGREQDRMSHVIVDEAYEKCPEFFFPTKRSKKMMTTDGREVDARDCEITMANIPFLRMRDRIHAAGYDFASRSFTDVIDFAQLASEATELVLDPANSRIALGGKVLKLSSSPMAFLLWQAKRTLENRFIAYPTVDDEEVKSYAKNGAGYWNLFSEHEADNDFQRDAKEWFACFIECEGDDPVEDWQEQRWNTNRSYKRVQHGIHKRWWDDCRSNLRRALMKEFGDKAFVEKYLPTEMGAEGEGHGYGLSLPAANIQINAGNL